MKRLSLLKAIISVLFVINIIVVAFGVPFTLIYAIAPQRVPTGIVNGLNNTNPGATITALNLFIALAGAACGAYALYCLKQALTFFSKGKYFDGKVVKMLAKTGEFTIASCILVSFAFVIIPAANGAYRINAGINFSSILVLGLGLLFLVLADVFNAARKLKEENDLTV